MRANPCLNMKLNKSGAIFTKVGTLSALRDRTVLYSTTIPISIDSLHTRHVK